MKAEQQDKQYLDQKFDINDQVSNIVEQMANIIEEDDKILKILKDYTYHIFKDNTYEVKIRIKIKEITN